MSDGGSTDGFPDFDDDDDPAKMQVQMKMVQDKARKALEYYMDTTGEECELVEVQLKDQEGAVVPPYCVYHLTFTAKPKNSSSPKLFFAEVYEHCTRLYEYEVKICTTLDDDCEGGVTKGCGYILGDPDMLHPKDVVSFAGPPGSPIMG